MDMPKIYLWRRRNGEFDVVDGQQRLRAIWEFIDNIYALNHTQVLQPIGKVEIAGKFFDELTPNLQRKLRDFEASIAQIEKAKTQDITLLFARLQLAAPLNSAELRNAILCPLRHEVDVTALNHDFFESCRISSARMKHQDYTAHAYALSINGHDADLKAPDLRELYLESPSTSNQEMMDRSIEVDRALELLRDVNVAANYRITQKWIFCDLIYFLIKQVRSGAFIDTDEMARLYLAFETKRLANIRDSDALLEGEHSDADQDLYDYIQAFRIEGGKQHNITVRAGVFDRLFEECIA
jgi:hypothetical protein